MSLQTVIMKSFKKFNEGLEDHIIDGEGKPIIRTGGQLKNNRVWASLGRDSIISGNWDDGYEFDGTLEDLSNHITNLTSGLSDEEKDYIISKL